MLLAGTSGWQLLSVRVETGLEHNGLGGSCVLGKTAASGADQSQGELSRELAEGQAPVQEQVY